MASVFAPGTSLPSLEKPRFTSSHILRWLAAQQNWDKIHFDQWFCREVAKLQAPVINGALKQHLMVQFLREAFPCAWPWRIDYKFVGPDFVGDKLQVRGEVTGSETADGRIFVSVQIDIFNTDRFEVTTRGTAVVLVEASGAPVLDALGIEAPRGLGLSREVSPVDEGTAENISRRLGTKIDARESRYAIDLSRLRLFADAVMGLSPMYFDSEAGAASVYGQVVAPPLFPLHGIESLPGSLPLSEDLLSQGREGVNEVGRDLATLFGINPAGGMNAGNQVEIHSLARVGERVCADSTLVGARRRTGKRGGDMVFFETLNRYWESGGRLLVMERQTVVVRLV